MSHQSSTHSSTRPDNSLKRLFSWLKVEGCIVLSCVLFLILSAGGISKYDLWRDESFSVNVAQKPVVQLITTVARDVHPPLHLLLLKGWMGIFGSSVIAVRSLSVAFGLLTIVLSAVLARLVLTDKKQQHWVVLLVATAPHLLFYSLEARVYTMLMASILGVCITFLLSLKSTKRWVDVAFIGAVLSGLYGHVVFIPAMLGVVVWQLILITLEARQLTAHTRAVFFKRILLRYLVNYLIIAVGFSPWLAALYYQLTQVGEQGFWLTFSPIPDLVSSLDQFFITQQASTSANWIAPLVLLVLSHLGFAFNLIGILRSNRYRFIPLLSVLTVVPVYLISFHTPIYFIRYLLYVTPLVAFSITAGVLTLESSIGKRLTHTVLFLLVLLQVYVFAGNVMQLPGIKAEYRQAISYVHQNFPQATILHPHGYTLHSFIYYSKQQGLEPGKLYDPERKLPHFEGLAAFTDQEYYAQALGSDSWLATPYYGEDANFETHLKAVGYTQVAYAEFDGGLHIKVWKKLQFAAR